MVVVSEERLVLLQLLLGILRDTSPVEEEMRKYELLRIPIEDDDEQGLRNLLETDSEMKLQLQYKTEFNQVSFIRIYYVQHAPVSYTHLTLPTTPYV